MGESGCAVIHSGLGKPPNASCEPPNLSLQDKEVALSLRRGLRRNYVIDSNYNCCYKQSTFTRRELPCLIRWMSITTM
jgi:hypothetical protein